MIKTFPYGDYVASCKRCAAEFSWVFVETISEGDVYECDFCNNIVVITNMKWDNDN